MSTQEHTTHAAQPEPKRKRKLTVKQLLAKFPDMDEEEKVNCLEDMACPHCGQRESFRIQVTTIVEIFDNGTDDHEDTEWDEKSFCSCTNSDCHGEGKVKDFTFKGLDQEIYHRIEAA